MREFDFDELDRAVNSVLNKTQADSPASDSNAAPQPEAATSADTSPQIVSHPEHSRLVASERGSHRQAMRRRTDAVIPSSPAETELASVSKAEESGNTEPESVETPPVKSPAAEQGSRPSRPPAPRQSGRFMDMVHPSSDMSTNSFKRKDFQYAVPTPEVTRPSASAASEVKPAAETSFDTPSSPPAPAEDIEKAINDMLADEVSNSSTSEVATNADEAKTAPEQEAQASPAAPDQQRQDDQSIAAALAKEQSAPSPPAETLAPALTAHDSTSTAPQTSPFLTNAQVDKRPLGAARQSNLEGDMPKNDFSSIQNQTTGQPDSASEGDSLHTKIQAIESIEADVSASGDSQNKAAAFNSPPTQENAAKQEQFMGKSEGDKNTALSQNEKTREDFASARKDTPAQQGVAGPSSIARQYKESPLQASEDDTNAIFDPDNYRQPLEHTAKKKSGWGLVIAIVALIVLGGVALVLLWWSGLLVVPS